MPATLKDVAQRANVSIRTVSNVVTGYVHVSEKMRRRVQNAIDELGYRPNLVARNLRTGRTGTLALVVPEIDAPYFSELSRDVINVASELGYRVMIEQTGHDHDRERELLTSGNRNMLFDGILFSPLVTQDELLEMVPQSPVPIVFLGEHHFDGRYDHVSIDNFLAARDATQHLIDLGRHRIATIGEQPFERYETPHLRSEGYGAALKMAGLPLNPMMMKPAAHYSRADGYAAAEELLTLSLQPDAIFCYSDLLAVGAMRAIFDSGLRVPEDIAIIGIDNIEEGKFSRPRLSTVSLDTPFIARQAVSHLLARIADPAIEAVEIVAPHSLIVRESTGGNVSSKE